MESSEDEEFGWTNTSNDDSDTGPEMHNDEESESGQSFKNKLQKELLLQNGDISEPDETPRKRKKKLKKPKREASSRSHSPSPTSFHSPRRVKRESLDATDGHDDSAAAERLLNMKVKEERLSFAVPRDSPRKRRASAAEPGLDPDPDPDQPRKKKKKRERDEREEPSANETVVPADDPPVSPRKKKTAKERHDRESSANEAFGPSDVPSVSIRKKKRDDRVSLPADAEDGPGDVSAENHVDGLGELPRIKKKKLKTDDSNEKKNYEGCCKFDAEETVVERRPKEKPERDPSPTKPYPSKEFLPTDDESSADERPAAAAGSARPQTSPTCEKAPRRPRLSERITFEGESESEGARKISHALSGSPRRARIADRIKFEDDSQTGSETPDRTGESPQKGPQPVTDRRRISDRITFEDSRASESEPERGAARAADSGLGRFLRAHAHMRPVLGAVPRGAALTADDDVWLVRCPRDLPAAALRGLTLDLAFRSKLKVAGRAYEAAPLAGEARAALLAPAARGRGQCVRTVPLRGALRLRARPPRPRAPPPAADAEPEHVPLPPTRPRHPLFGADYERAALPPDVRRRLAAAAATRDAVDEGDRTDGVGERREKRKKKKHRERAEPEPESEPEQKWRPVEKKRKRKHSSRHAPDPPPEPDPPRESERELESPPRKKKAKKEKKRSDGAVAWDSERAIEESLFNY